MHFCSVLSAVQLRRMVASFHVLQTLTATGGASMMAVSALRCVDLVFMLTGSLICLGLTGNICCSAPTRAQRRRPGSDPAAALLCPLLFLTRGLVHNDELVLLPVSGFDIFRAF